MTTSKFTIFLCFARNSLSSKAIFRAIKRPFLSKYSTFFRIWARSCCNQKIEVPRPKNEIGRSCLTWQDDRAETHSQECRNHFQCVHNNVQLSPKMLKNYNGLGWGPGGYKDRVLLCTIEGPLEYKQLL